MGNHVSRGAWQPGHMIIGWKNQTSYCQGISDTAIRANMV